MKGETKMKYIRTKDGKIHEIVLKQSNIYFVKANLSDGSDIFGDFCYSQEDIFKESDTIEELCDEFVSKNKLLSPKYIDPRESELQSWKNCFEEELIVKCNKEIWGCIWVFDDNGAPTLKPVAKMNENGDLKLL